jgi:hypothetical protein
VRKRAHRIDLPHIPPPSPNSHCSTPVRRRRSCLLVACSRLLVHRRVRCPPEGVFPSCKSHHRHRACRTCARGRTAHVRCRGNTASSVSSGVMPATGCGRFSGKNRPPRANPVRVSVPVGGWGGPG